MADVWRYSTVHRCACKLVEQQSLWGETVCHIWLPDRDEMARVPGDALQPLPSEVQPEVEADRVAYLAAAAKVAEVIEGASRSADGQVLLAPMESNVIPLPHQLHALSRAISGDRVRYLLADEVGLGKTIEAGLVMRELKLRGQVRRTLVVVPKGLTGQWVEEMRTHFNERFQLVLGDDIGALHRLAQGRERQSSAWSLFDQVIVSLDSVKPIDRRRGWSEERVAEYNRSRFDELVVAGWDLVVVDEAHRLGGSTESVARHRLGRGLADAAPSLLLLSATPHQGKSDAFQRLMSLLDDAAFPDENSVSRERVAPYVIRTEKRRAVDAEGGPLFKPRRTQTATVAWDGRHQLQRLLYDAVGDYARTNYNLALRENNRHIGFLMMLLQRLVVSSTRAIRTTLERRLAVLEDNERQASSQLLGFEGGGVGTEDVDELYEMDGQQLLDKLLQSRMSALRDEKRQVKTLLDTALRCEQQGPDAKAEQLLWWMQQLQSEESDSELKVLIFTEFVPTQGMLAEFLESRGVSTVCLNGSMDTLERKRAQSDFQHTRRVLISTDAGGEGLNLQFAHTVINYDIPWNPMRLEQRIGRVDRIGQGKPVRAINFVFQDSVEFRVREVLEQKLAVIFDEFGIDKTGDVLDSAQAGAVFEEVFASAILGQDDVKRAVNHAVDHIRDEMRRARSSSPSYTISERPDLRAAERLRSHPLPHWVETMTLAYLQSHGGSARRRQSWWELSWPDGQVQRKCVFHAREAERLADATLLNLEHERVRQLARTLPRLAEGQPVPCVSVAGLPASVSGVWGLFELRLQAGLARPSPLLRIPLLRRSYTSVFVSDEGKLFLPTARRIWDLLQSERVQVHSTLDRNESLAAHTSLREAAEHAGATAFDSLRREHLAALDREQQRGRVSFASRRRVIERVGLPEVRQFRLTRLAASESEWRDQLEQTRRVLPEIRPLLALRVVQDSSRA